MPPFYGANEKPNSDLVPDWLLGGNRKRRVLAALAERDSSPGWKSAGLAQSLGCGRTTVFEIVRALRALDVLEEDEGGRVWMDGSTPLGKALIDLLQAVNAFSDQSVDRPPRARDLT